MGEPLRFKANRTLQEHELCQKEYNTSLGVDDDELSAGIEVFCCISIH